MGYKNLFTVAVNLYSRRVKCPVDWKCIRPAVFCLFKAEFVFLRALRLKRCLLMCLQVLGDLRADNQRLKDENAALIRVISKLSR